ncbi:hypothetical protein [Selenomonas ruminantium]|nr:hypothetical protein [Selenomonas ruminantium]
MASESLHAQRQKRALNIVWTAAGKYDFRPEFLAFYHDGEPDRYLNSIVGLVHRHYDAEKLTAYLRERLAGSLLGELYTDLFWLGLESAVYERELPFRPVLADLRHCHAERFLREDVDLSFQQLMMRQELAHTLNCARCREVLGKGAGLLNPWDRQIYQALCFRGDMDTADLIAAMEGIIKDFFCCHWYVTPRKALHFSLPSWLHACLYRLLPIHSRYGQADAGGSWQPCQGQMATGGKSLLPGRQWAKIPASELTDRYGASLFRQEQLLEIEGEMCQDIHCQSQLWFTQEKGEACRENLVFFQQQQARFRTELQTLTRRLQNVMLVHRQPLALPARHGQLTAERVWRGVVLQDSRIFSATEKASYGDFSVMLLLDASDSRKNRQAVIASQAYLIAMALGQAGIPLAAVSFFSQAGCTVLQVLKGFADCTAEGIFSYKAQGWNRDGLALRAVAKLWGERQGRKLVLLLTDANPSDEQPIPAAWGMDDLYGGKPALADAAQGVKLLKEQGFHVLALVNSAACAALAAETAHKIYGENFVQLQDLSQMANKVGDLLETEMQR